jgi:hypothetical protein
MYLFLLNKEREFNEVYPVGKIEVKLFTTSYITSYSLRAEN